MMGDNKRKKGSKHVFTFDIDEPSDDDSDGDPDFSVSKKVYYDSDGEQVQREIKRSFKKKKSHKSSQGRVQTNRSDPQERIKDDEAASKRFRRTCSSVEYDKFHINSMPDEILLKIFSYLLRDSSFPCLFHLSQVCQLWRKISGDPSLHVRVNLSQYLNPYSKPLVITKALTSSNFSRSSELDLSNCKNLNDNHLKIISENFPNLKSINLSYCEEISTNAFLVFIRDVPSIVNYSLTGSSLCKNQFISKLLLEKDGKVEGLKLGGQDIRNPTFKTILSKCPNLKVLDLSNSQIDRINIDVLQESCPSITELNLANCNIVLQVNRNSLPKGFPSLSLLSLTNCILKPEDGKYHIMWDRLLHFTEKLKVLDVRSNLHFFNSLPENIHFPSLQILFASRSNGVNYHNLNQILGSQIKILDLSWTKVDDNMCNMISQKTNESLEFLDLSGTLVTTHSVLRLVRDCKNLYSLDLSSCRGIPRGIKNKHEGKSQLESILTL